MNEKYPKLGNCSNEFMPLVVDYADEKNESEHENLFITDFQYCHTNLMLVALENVPKKLKHKDLEL